MPNIISSVFQPDESEQGHDQTTTVTGDGETGVEVSPSVEIGLSGSYEDADGTGHEWSNETAIGTDVDLNAAFGVTETLTSDSINGAE